MGYLLLGYILGVSSVFGMIYIADKENKRRIESNVSTNKRRTRFIYGPNDK